jgi:hypothetical protein
MNRTSMQLTLLALVSVAMACASPPKETGVVGAPRETGVAGPPKETDAASATKGSDVAFLSAPLETGDIVAVDSAPGHGSGHLKAVDHCYYDTTQQKIVCTFSADSAPGHGGGPHKAVSADSAPGHGGGGQKLVSDSAPGHGGGPHKAALLLECADKPPNQVECTAPVTKR